MGDEDQVAVEGGNKEEGEECGEEKSNEESVTGIKEEKIEVKCQVVGVREEGRL